LDTIGHADVQVAKFGGNDTPYFAENFATVEELRADGADVIVVVSALKREKEDATSFKHPSVVDLNELKEPKKGFNTTSHLIKAAELLKQGRPDEAVILIEHVRRFMHSIVEERCKDDQGLSAGGLSRMHAVIDVVLDDCIRRIRLPNRSGLHQVGTDWILQDQEGFYSITGAGERLAEELYRTYFSLRELPLNALRGHEMAPMAYENNPVGLQSPAHMKRAIGTVCGEMRSRMGSLIGNSVHLTGGYVGFGGVRNYSDFTAGQVTAAAIPESSLEPVNRTVQMLVPRTGGGIRSRNPKLGSSSQIDAMGYPFAREAFGSQRGAEGGAVHPEALALLAHTPQVRIVIFDPKQPKELGTTHIGGEIPDRRGIEMVAVRPMPLALEVNAVFQTGDIERLSAWFKDQDVSIAHVIDSEGTVTFTFRNGGLHPDRVARFREFVESTLYGATVEECRDRATLHCMGNNVEGLAPLEQAAGALDRAGIRVHRYWSGSANSIIFIVAQAQAQDALNAVHDSCIGATV
jgi:aspartokinase